MIAYSQTVPYKQSWFMPFSRPQPSPSATDANIASLLIQVSGLVGSMKALSTILGTVVTTNSRIENHMAQIDDDLAAQTKGVADLKTAVADLETGLTTVSTNLATALAEIAAGGTGAVTPDQLAALEANNAAIVDLTTGIRAALAAVPAAPAPAV